MFKHLVRLIWNKKRSHTLLIVEILVSFLVLFGITSLIVYNLKNYAEPIGYQYENRWVIDLNHGETPDSLAYETRQRLKLRSQSYPEVEAATLSSGNSPFSMSRSNGNVKYKDVVVKSDNYWVDQDFARTMEIPLIEGRWFDKSDDLPGARPIIINQIFKEKVFGTEPAVGKIIQDNNEKGDKKRIVGVVGNYKSGGEYTDNSPATFYKANKNDWNDILILKVRPGTDARFEAQLMKDLGNTAKGWNLELSYMTDQRQNKHNLTLVPVIIFLVISGFLLINVALGLFGVLNLSIAKRKNEIGVRRAMGATETGISTQFIGEIWVLATFGLLIGFVFAAQFPLMNVFDLRAGVYLTAIAVSAFVIYLIVTLCALFPSRQAARIQPAVALHEE